ncbi:phosphate-starvation-inducible PsiE family protein [Capillibacterium thermochitinicola]|uniref:Transporter associated domain-containing protein n=1 Tax=Capillibacterium thermochitinicola TaxID=2699427 RepID=A0A8J6HSQ0_9FIRM|nr:phosphate-starvation-inducible PsiE family protein [Capillibacterium thermochitinicola]MBA2133461.1 hypothetical protein [Capillibacterium thermochitinicola]
MRFRFRNHLLRWSVHIEIFLAFLLLIGILISAGGLVTNLYGLTRNLGNTEYFQKFLGAMMALIIALELIKMIVRNTVESTIEVLLIAIARKLIVSEQDTLGFLIGIMAIAGLFFIRKYLFVAEFANHSRMVVSAGMSVAEAEKLIKKPLPRQAQTLGGVVAQIAREEKRKLQEGEVYDCNGVKIRINRMEDGIIHILEFVDNHE